jgi:hypothetical protein
VRDCYLTPIQQFVQLYHGENKLMFNEMMMRSALFYIGTQSWTFIVLAHWNNSPQVDISFHSGTVFWFRANQSFSLSSYCCVLRGEATTIIVFGLTGPGLEHTIYSTRGEYANHYATDTVKILKIPKCNQKIPFMCLCFFSFVCFQFWSFLWHFLWSVCFCRYTSKLWCLVSSCIQFIIFAVFVTGY